jgi:hypothetical protein
MQRIAHSVVVEASIDEVFAYASDWRFWADWFDGFADCSAVAGTERGNGAIYDYKMRVLGFTFKLKTEIHNFVENKGWNGIGIEGVPHKTTWIFEELDSHTKLTYIAEYSLPVPILGPVTCFLFTDPAWRRILRRSLNNFAAHFRG